MFKHFHSVVQVKITTISKTKEGRVDGGGVDEGWARGGGGGGGGTD